MATKYVGQLGIEERKQVWVDDAKALGLAWILTAWADAENRYDLAEIKRELIQWLSHWASVEFSLSQWEGVRIAGTFPAKKADVSKRLLVALANQAKIYVLARAVGFTDQECGTFLQAGKAIAAERSYQEGKKYFVLRKKRAKVVGKGASGRAVTRCKTAYVKQVDNGSRVADPVKPTKTVKASKPKATPEDLNALVKKIREGGG